MRKRILWSIGLVCLLAGQPVLAADYASIIVAQLQDQGYSRIETETTWLGRVRIVAERESGTREIILNPRTGEILRDLWLLTDGEAMRSADSQIIDDDKSGKDSDDDSDDDSSNSGSGSSGSDDSGSDDSGSDDSSGSDSSGSGSGSDDGSDDD